MSLIFGSKNAQDADPTLRKAYFLHTIDIGDIMKSITPAETRTVMVCLKDTLFAKVNPGSE